jgi:hypothetical protein
MASTLTPATLEQQPAVSSPAPASGPAVEELDRALTDGLKVLQDGAPKDPSYWLG